MSLRALIIDDEQKGIDALKILIQTHTTLVKVVADTNKASLAAELIEDYKPDIIFLDINMPEMDGFELLETLKWKEFYLIFCTAHSEYGLRALKNNASDFLLKPIDPEELVSAVHKVKEKMALSKNNLSWPNYVELMRHLGQGQARKVVIHSREGIESIDVSEIISLESKSNYTIFHVSGADSILSCRTLKEYDTQLCDSNPSFMRVHHSFIINLHCVARYIKSTETVVMSNNLEIPLARSRKGDFLRWLDLV